MKEENLIDRHPRIFGRITASTHDYEICVRFVNCKSYHLTELNERCTEVQRYLDYMNTSQKYIKQVVITEVIGHSDKMSIRYEGGDDFTSEILGVLHEQTARR